MVFCLKSIYNQVVLCCAKWIVGVWLCKGSTWNCQKSQWKMLLKMELNCACYDINLCVASCWKGEWCLCRALGGCLDENTYCYTLEVSFYSYTINQGTQSVTLPYTEEGCILGESNSNNKTGISLWPKIRVEFFILNEYFSLQLLIRHETGSEPGAHVSRLLQASRLHSQQAEQRGRHQSLRKHLAWEA